MKLIKIIPCIMILSMVANIGITNIYANSNVYKINNMSDFEKFQQNEMDILLKNDVIELNVDLNFNNKEITPIGYGFIAKQFIKEFNGNGHTLKNFKINSQDENIGLFGKNLGYIHDLNIDNATINGKNNVGVIAGTSLYYGGLSVRDNSGKIINVRVFNSSIFGNDNVGGIVGKQVSGILDNSIIDNINIVGRNNVGGTVGASLINQSGKNSIIQNSALLNLDIRANNYVGGVVGLAKKKLNDTQTTIIDSVSVKEKMMIWAKENVGGVVGNLDGILTSATIDVNKPNNNPFWHNIYGTNEVGGIVGDTGNEDGHNYIDSVKSNAFVLGTNEVGGVAGDNDTKINNAEFWGKITGDTQLGGIAGSNSSKIYDSKNYASVYCNSAKDIYCMAGGFVGISTGSEAYIENGYTSGNLYAQGGKIGGFAGQNTRGAKIYKGYVGSMQKIVKVQSSGEFVGGFVGLNSENANILIAKSHANVEAVTGKSIGGFVGMNYTSSIIKDSVATGNVIGSVNVTGEFAGTNHSNAKIEKSKTTNIGIIDTTKNPFVGYNEKTGIVIM
jgi:hypothetical protein